MTLLGTRVLVVDDDPVTRRALRTMLQKLEAETLEASDGVQALAALDEAHRLPHVALVDLMMPNMNGVDLAARLRDHRRYRRIRLVAVTGLDAPDAKIVTWALGFKAHLVKPVSMRTLEATMRAALGRSAESPARKPSRRPRRRKRAAPRRRSP